MKQFLEASGKTEEEAIQSALDQLHLDRDDVSVEILERAKAGFLGIGGTLATVRVSYDDGKSEPVAKPEKPVVYQAEVLQKDVRERERAERAEKKAAEKAAEQAILSGEECTDEKATAVRTFLEGLLQHMEVAAQVKVYEAEKNRYKVYLDGEKLGALIGRRGSTLDAIQQLTNYAVNHGSEHNRVRVQVDAENYREKREQNLEQLAEKVAAKAVKYHRNVTLEPMNAYERHVIHAALQDNPAVSTFSIGSEPNRRVVVAFGKQQ